MRRLVLPPPTVHRPEPGQDQALALLLGGAFAMALLVLGALVGGWSLSPLTWYIARSSGLVLYLLTWFGMMSGMGMTTKLLARLGSRGTTLSVHAYAFHLWYGFLLLHVVSLVLDPTVSFGPRDLVVPLVSGYREPWTGLGVLAAEVSLVVGASFGIRRIIGYRAWRALHWLAFPVFLIGLAHGVGAGTDTRDPAVLGMYVITGGSVLVMALYRLLRGSQKERPLPEAPPAPRDRLQRASGDGWR